MWTSLSRRAGALALLCSAACASTTTDSTAAADVPDASDVPVALDAPDVPRTPDVPDVPAARDVPDVPAPMDVPVAADAPARDASPSDRPTPIDRPAPACRWTAGALVDPVVAPAMAGYVEAAVPVDGGLAVLVERIGALPDGEKLALDFVGTDGRPTGVPLTFGTEMDSGGGPSLAVRAGTGEMGVLTDGYGGGYLYLVAADRTLRRVVVTTDSASARDRRLMPTATGYSFVRVSNAAPRLHRVDVDADGVLRGDATIPIPVGPISYGLGLQVNDPLLALERATAADGSSITVTAEAFEGTAAGGVGVRVAYALAPPGSAVTGVPSVYEDRDTSDGIAVMPDATGALLAYVRSIRPSHSPVLGADFTVQPVDLAGHPTTPAVTWSLPGYDYLYAAAAGTPRGPVVVLPVAGTSTTPLASVARYVAQGIGADGAPEGDAVPLPFPADAPLFDRAVVAPTPTGALALALVADRATSAFRVVGVPLRCE